MAASIVNGVVLVTPPRSTFSPAGTVWNVRFTSSGASWTELLVANPLVSVTVQMTS